MGYDLTVSAISSLANLVLAGAAVAGSVAAFMGLHTWKRQMSGEHEAQLARQILVLVYRHRDSINGVRDPLILSNETYEAMTDEDRDEPQDTRRFLEVARVYEKRWDKVVDVRSKLYPYLLEADAIWGDTVRIRIAPIFELENELIVYVQKHLRTQNPNLHVQSREAAQRFLDRRRDVLYSDWDEQDDFKNEYNQALTSTENLLRGKFVAA